jgi:hypothetical protein
MQLGVLQETGVGRTGPGSVLVAGLHSRNNRTSAFSATRMFPMPSSGQRIESSSVQLTR